MVNKTETSFQQIFMLLALFLFKMDPSWLYGRNSHFNLPLQKVWEKYFKDKISTKNMNLLTIEITLSW